MEAAATFAVDRDARGQRTHWHDAPPVVVSAADERRVSGSTSWAGPSWAGPS